MIKVMGYELKGKRIDCLYDDLSFRWFVMIQDHPIYCQSFLEASEKMDEAIQELNNLEN